MSEGSRIIGFWTSQVDILADRNITSFLARSMRVTSSRCMITTPAIVMRMVPKDSDIRSGEMHLPGKGNRCQARPRASPSNRYCPVKFSTMHLVRREIYATYRMV